MSKGKAKRFKNFIFGSVETKDNENFENDLVTQRKLVSQWKIDVNMARCFFAVLIITSIIAMIPSFRSSYSEIEKRDLKKFPEFSFKALASGDYFDEINLWFSDTFPLRDKFVELNSYIKDAFGNSDVKVHGEVEKGDEIPDITGKPSGKPSDNPSVNDSSSDSTTSEPEEEDTVEKMGAILVIDNAGYEYYNFGIKTANVYIENMNRAADNLNGKANFYNIIVPTSMAITAPDDIVQSVSTADQKKAIDYMYNSYNGNVFAVDVYPTLREHRDEYLYFRTDHHWTALGAYYTYAELMNAMSKTPASLDSFIEHRFEGFLGSFYSKSGKMPQLGNTPDTVYAYEPPQFNTIVTTLDTGEVVKKNIISNGNNMSAGSKYLSFVTGDKPFGVMTNPTINDGSACIIVKESFGNCFVPFLTQNYQNVYVVDYRYFNKIDTRNLTQLVDDTGAQDVIFINNISATRNRSLVDYMGNFIGPKVESVEPQPPTEPGTDAETGTGTGTETENQTPTPALPNNEEEKAQNIVVQK